MWVSLTTKQVLKFTVDVIFIHKKNALKILCTSSFKVHFSQRSTLTSVSVVKIDEPLPLVMIQQVENNPLQTGPHLEDKLHIGVDGEAGRDEGCVQSPAEGGQRVHGFPVIEAEYGVYSSGELGADW